jgi:integrase
VRRGKGGKQRDVPLHPDCVAGTAAWLALRGDAPGPLLLALDRAATIRTSGDLAARRLTTQAVRDVCARRGAEAGVASFRPHDFRRTAAGDWASTGADIVSAQRLMGHADPRTTSRYDRRPIAARRAAVLARPIPV